jgi:Transposase
MAENVEFPGISDDRKLKVLTALVECRGIISDASQATQVARSTIYDWIAADEQFKAAVEAAREVSIDRVEKKLFDQIDKDDTTAIIFFLKTRAKKRGYVERHEHTGENGKAINLIFKRADEQP